MKKKLLGHLQCNEHSLRETTLALLFKFITSERETTLLVLSDVIFFKFWKLYSYSPCGMTTTTLECNHFILGSTPH